MTDVLGDDREVSLAQGLNIALEALAAGVIVLVSGKHGDAGVTDVEKVSDRTRAGGAVLNQHPVDGQVGTSLS